MRLIGALLVALTSLIATSAAGAAPEGQMTWGVHTTLVPSYFDPGETTIGTAFMVLYGLHDALVKPMPGKAVARAWPSRGRHRPRAHLLVRPCARGPVHNGDPVTAEDAKFSFDRYRGIYARHLKEMVAAVEAPEPGLVRFRLKQPWPDFMVYLGTYTASAGWVVPKKYLEQVGEDGFKKAPVGAGPYRFVSFNPGIELVLEAFDGYWRKPPSVKRLVFRIIPDPATRVAALKRGEVDLAFSMGGELAEEVKRTPGLSLKAVYASIHWLAFPDQWDAKSPWHDRRVRQAVNLAIDRQAVNQVRTFGLSKNTGTIVASSLDFSGPPPFRPSSPPGPSNSWPRPAIRAASMRATTTAT